MEVKRLCDLIGSAEAQINEYSLRIRNGLVRVESQLDVLKRVHHLMSAEHREVNEITLDVLCSKLNVLTRLIRGVTKPEGGVKRFKYVFKKEAFEQAVADFETWQATADTSWFLLMRMPDILIDNALHENPATTVIIPSSITIRENIQGGPPSAESPSPLGSPSPLWSPPLPGSPSPGGPSAIQRPSPVQGGRPAATGLTLSSRQLRSMRISDIPRCDAQVAKRTDPAGNHTLFILNRLGGQSLDQEHIVKRDVRDLACKLRQSDATTFGFLQCKGFVTDSSKFGFSLTLVFRQPTSYDEPRSFRDLLLNNTVNRSISSRLNFAKQLAKSVSYVHAFNFVHKNIRPESILVFDEAPSEVQSSNLFLVGFENFRRDRSQTLRLADDLVEKNIYRHPSRQGINPVENYSMHHDIYSLGVCLLEIGLWESFVNYDEQNRRTAAPSLLLPSGSGLGEFTQSFQALGKDYLLSLARFELPWRMGDKYLEVVETCLTCLDPENTDFSNQEEFEDKNGILIGARYIEKVKFVRIMLHVIIEAHSIQVLLRLNMLNI